MERECGLLKRYAARPTLVEYERSPALKGVMEAGATFGVTAIVGEVLLANIRVLADVFTYANSDNLSSASMCTTTADPDVPPIVLPNAPVVEIRYARGTIAGVCLQGHCNFGGDDEQSNWSSWLSLATQILIPMRVMPR
jgi:hypothetical protein